jgi:hypothetical protein
MDGECSTYGKRVGIFRVLVGTLGERDHLGDPGVDGRIILRCVFRKRGMDWIELALDRDM